MVGITFTAWNYSPTSSKRLVFSIGLNALVSLSLCNATFGGGVLIGTYTASLPESEMKVERLNIAEVKLVHRDGRHYWYNM